MPDLRTNPLYKMVLNATCREGGRIRTDRLRILVAHLGVGELSQCFDKVLEENPEAKQKAIDVVLDFDFGEDLDSAFKKTLLWGIEGEYVDSATLVSRARQLKAADREVLTKCLADLDVNDGDNGSEDEKDFKGLAETLREADVGTEDGRAHLDGLGLQLQDFADMTADEWKEILPVAYIATRTQLRRHLRSSGFRLVIDAPTSVPAPQTRTSATIEAELRAALTAGDFDAARALKLELRGLSGSDSKRELARSKAQEMLEQYQELQTKALAALDVDECERLASKMAFASKVAAGEGSDDDFRRFLAVEEQVRQDSSPTTVVNPASRLDSVMAKLNAFLPQGRSPNQASTQGIQSTLARPSTKAFTILPTKGDDKTLSGMDNVMSLYKLDDPEAKVEPAHELRKTAKNYARMHPHVLFPVPINRDNADGWVTICEQRYREGNMRLSAEERRDLEPPEHVVFKLFYDVRGIIATSADVLGKMEHASIVFGYLAMIGCHCALGGAQHFDHYFDREKNQGMVSTVVLNKIRSFALDYVKYKGYQQSIHHETQMSKAKYANLHRKLLLEDAAAGKNNASGGSERSGSKSSTDVETWEPSAIELKLERHPLDKVGPSNKVIRCIRGFYEKVRAIAPSNPGCKHCALPHDPDKTVCYLEKFPAHRSAFCRKAFRLAVKNGMLKAGDVDEWNGRQGREDADKCDAAGKHKVHKGLQHLRKGLPGGP